MKSEMLERLHQMKLLKTSNLRNQFNRELKKNKNQDKLLSNLLTKLSYFISLTFLQDGSSGRTTKGNLLVSNNSYTSPYLNLK